MEVRLQDIQISLRDIKEDLKHNVITLAKLESREHPCKEYDGRIKKLENTKSSLSGGWKVIVIISGVIFGLGTIGGLAVGIMSLWK